MESKVKKWQLQDHQLELDEFWEKLSCAWLILNIHCVLYTVPLDGVLLQQAEWLLRDVLLIEELLPQPDDEIQILTQAVSGVLVIVQGLYILPGCKIC